MEVPKTLYKYVIPDRIDILNNRYIRFTQPSALNDPFELLPMFEELFPENIVMETILNPPFEYIEEALGKQYENLSSEQKTQISLEQLISIIRKNPQLVKNILKEIEPTLSKEVKEFTPKAKDMLSEMLQTNLGILSLSETIENPLLWSHYAFAHKGFAIEFDTAHDFFNRRRSDKDELFHLRKVKYENRSSLGRTLIDLDGDDLLITKDKSWTYEDEWRILVPLESADKVLDVDNDKIFLFEVPPSAITAIILGGRTSSSLHEELKCCLESLDMQHIKLKRAELNITNQQIQVNEL